MPRKRRRVFCPGGKHTWSRTYGPRGYECLAERCGAAKVSRSAVLLAPGGGVVWVCWRPHDGRVRRPAYGYVVPVRARALALLRRHEREVHGVLVRPMLPGQLRLDDALEAREGRSAASG